MEHITEFVMRVSCWPVWQKLLSMQGENAGMPGSHTLGPSMTHYHTVEVSLPAPAGR